MDEWIKYLRSILLTSKILMNAEIVIVEKFLRVSCWLLYISIPPPNPSVYFDLLRFSQDLGSIFLQLCNLFVHPPIDLSW